MHEQRVTVASASGLHARPASLLTQAVASSGLSVTIGRIGEEPVDAASILSVMSLGIHQGEEVVLVSGADSAAPLLDELVELLASDLDGAA